MEVPSINFESAVRPVKILTPKNAQGSRGNLAPFFRVSNPPYRSRFSSSIARWNSRSNGSASFSPSGR